MLFSSLSLFFFLFFSLLVKTFVYFEISLRVWLLLLLRLLLTSETAIALNLPFYSLTHFPQPSQRNAANRPRSQHRLRLRDSQLCAKRNMFSCQHVASAQMRGLRWVRARAISCPLLGCCLLPPLLRPVYLYVGDLPFSCLPAQLVLAKVSFSLAAASSL